MLKNQTSSAEEGAFEKAQFISAELSSWPKPTISLRGPRIVETSRDARVLLGLLVGIGLLVSTVGGYGIDREYRELAQLEQSGVAVQGKIQDYDVGEDSTHVRYDYGWRGDTFSGRDGVDRRFMDSNPVGTSLAITLLPTQPSLHRVGEVRPGASTAKGTKLLIAASFLITLFGTAFVYARRAIRQHRVILQNWPASVGVVSRVTPVQDGEGGTNYRVEYRYPVAGSIRTQTTTRSHRMEEGAVLDLLVNPENPLDVRPRSSLYFARLPEELS